MRPDSSVRGCSEALLNQMREQKEFIAGLQLIIGEQRGLSAGDVMKPYSGGARWGPRPAETPHSQAPDLETACGAQALRSGLGQGSQALGCHGVVPRAAGKTGPLPEPED